MANLVFMNDDDIIECQVIGDQTAESVQAMGKKIAALLDENKSIHNGAVLDDIIKIGKVPPAARNYVVSLAKDLPYSRLAMVGKGSVIRFGANMLIHASGRRSRLRFFNDRSQAIAWLKAKH